MDKIKELLPILAIFISLLALIVSILNYFNARKNRKITEKQFFNRQSMFSLYLNNSYAFLSEDKKYSLFNITVLNKSETKNSFLVTLEIIYSFNDSLSKIKIPYDKLISNKIPQLNYTFFETNIIVSEKETTTKWLIFEIPSKLKGTVIDKYEISFIDPHDYSQSITSIILKKLPDEI
ncbi:hypothetical protein PG614_03740 [Riemerella anatipestifer]|nr:hypothetical protein [Riemerella anatipestifer]MDY3532392.1 hypothetical protein [Riemerella anatipestifer]MDY3535053.1 hypothetical protein [Riemerella anatipestifer]